MHNRMAVKARSSCSTGQAMPCWMSQHMGTHANSMTNHDKPPSFFNLTFTLLPHKTCANLSTSNLADMKIKRSCSRSSSFRFGMPFWSSSPRNHMPSACRHHSHFAARPSIFWWNLVKFGEVPWKLRLKGVVGQVQALQMGTGLVETGSWGKELNHRLTNWLTI